MLPFYYLGCFVSSVSSVFASQRYARSGKKINNIHVYSIVTGLIAMMFFYISSGFKIDINICTLVYSVIFAILIFINYFLTLIVFRYMGIAEKTFICSGLSLIVITFMGAVAFDEVLTVKSYAQLLLVFATLFAIFLPAIRKKANEKTVTSTGVIVCVGTTILSVGCTLLSKYFAEDLKAGTVTDQNSFFFLTNVFIVFFGICTVLISQKFSIKAVVKEFKDVSPVNYFMIVLNVVSSNVHSLLQILILKEGDLILYAPLSSALALLAGEVVAVLFAKEKPRIVATILALLSVLVVLF